MISFSMVMQFLGGLGLFLYGVNTTAQGLQKLAANRLKAILESLTRRTWAATLFGMVMTVALQSSAATTVMVVEFVNSGLMTLTQALGVALGSTVGSSVVVQLISFPILNVALLATFIGFILLLIIRTDKAKLLGQVLIGFGCIFVGMAYLSGAFAPLRNAPQVIDFLSQLGTNPIVAILVGIFLTSLFQSSTAFYAVLISLAGHGLLVIESIVPLVMGAHIGGTITTLISSLGTEKIDAKRVAVANTTYRVVAAILLYPFITLFAQLVVWSTEDLARQVANAALFSAIFIVIIFLPFNRLLAKALIKIIPQRKKEEQELKLKYITKAALEVPTVAISQAGQEIRWLAHYILDHMFQVLPRALTSGDARWLNDLEKAEKQVDWYYNQINNFIRELFGRNITREQIVENHRLKLIVKELESIADCLVVVARLVQKTPSRTMKLTEYEWSHLGALYFPVSSDYLTLLRFLDLRDPAYAARIIETRHRIIESHNKLQREIMEEMTISENQASERQNIVLEAGNWLYKIEEHISSIVRE
ncbi:MAG: Na/Pi cotransporter family protein [Peptococcaceae bacterium]|nr:Na/Pi cotransporter family protein [Peptococcaceae bacterium]